MAINQNIINQELGRTSSLDSLVLSVFGSAARTADSSTKRLVGYSGSQPVYEVAIRTGTRVSKKLVTSDGSPFFGVPDPRPARGQPSQNELAEPSVVLKPGFDGNIIAGDELIAPGGITPILPTSGSVSMRDARAKLMAWVNNNSDFFSEGEIQDMIKSINQAGSKAELMSLQGQFVNTMNKRAVFDPVFGDPEAVDFGGGGGGGGGGGAFGPQYRAPDRRLVESFVKGELVTLVGTVPEGTVDGLVNLYMKDHRRNFDSLAMEIDPGMSVREAIRNTDLYKNIHKNRPESQNEERWISDRRAAAAEGGLNVNLQEDFAIRQAQAAGDIPDVADAAGVAQFQATGNVAGTTMESKMKNAAVNLFRGVVR